MPSDTSRETDRVRLLELLESFGLEPVLEAPKGMTVVALEAKRGGVGGYKGFACEFHFYPDGKFASVSVRE